MEEPRVVRILPKYKRGDRVTIVKLDLSFAGTYVQQATRKFLNMAATVEGTRATKYKKYIIKPDGYASTLCVDEDELKPKEA